jgi:outer membrane protein
VLFPIRPVIAACAASLAVLGLAPAAWAADLPSKRAAPVAELPVPDSWSPWMIRGRALVVLPDESAHLRAAGVALPMAKVDISTSVVPELDISYFFTKNIAAELILGVTPHQVKGAGSLAGTPIGKAWLLPPTLTIQYHFTELGAIKPYVGVGVNYTMFFDEKARGPFTSFKLKDTAGLALQAGVDIMLDKHWGLNIDVKKIFLEPKVALYPGPVTGKVKIDPWLIGTGVTYRF